MTANPLHGVSSAIRGWTPILCLSFGVPLLAAGFATPNELNRRATIPAWCISWGLIFAFFGAMKWLTWRRTSAPNVSPWRQMGYLFFWPGLDAPTFLRGTAARDAPVDPREGVIALGKLLLGAALFWGVARWVPNDLPLVQGWVGLAGLAIGLLGGAFHFASWLWRAGGVDAEPIMDAPLRARSMAEFWGLRWNRAFHDFVRRFIHRPIARRFGPTTATTAVFLFSGLLHDTILSIPAGAGYGRPTLYFLLQLVGLAIERSPFGKRLAVGRGLCGRLFAIAVIVGPAGLLFHRPFMERVWLPFMSAVQAS